MTQVCLRSTSLPPPSPHEMKEEPEMKNEHTGSLDNTISHTSQNQRKRKGYWDSGIPDKGTAAEIRVIKI